MKESHPRRVLVGVGPGDRRAALQFAAEEARRRGCGIHLLHVLHPAFGQQGVDLEMVRGELRHAGREVLTHAAHEVGRALGESDLPVTTELLHGHVAKVLVAASTQADLVVLQRQRAVPVSHLSTMSICNGTAARSRTPVAVVPRTWNVDDTAPVVIAVEDATDSPK